MPALAASPAAASPASAPKLLPSVRRALRVRHYSRRTEEAYVGWIRRFVRFTGSGIPPSWGSERSPSS